MNSRERALCAAVILAYAISGCATLQTHQADLSAKPQGVRIYPTKVYLLVDAERQKSHLVYLPDFERAYDIQPLAFLAEHEFKVDLDGGRLQSLTSKQDPTAILTFLNDAAAVGAAAAGAAVSKETLDGTFGMSSGIYVLTDEGIFQPIPGSPSD